MLDPATVTSRNRLAPLIKWAGGKEQELKYILPLVPSFTTYYEPFVGGGAVFFSIEAGHKFINDKSHELFNFYALIAKQDRGLFDALDILVRSWQSLSDFVDKNSEMLINIYKPYSLDACSWSEMEKILNELIDANLPYFQSLVVDLFANKEENFIAEIRRNLFSKVKRMRVLEGRKWRLPEEDILANLESAMKSAFYMHVRYLYNKIEQESISCGLAAAIFFFVRENAYASMFRYNKQGEFNVPYGGITYNRKDLARKIAYMRSPEICSHFQDTVIENMDFEAFLLKYGPKKGDFIFLDPPYDSEFSTYARNEFTLEDQKRLADYLIDRCEARFVLVIKNTSAISDLYGNKGLNIISFDKKYLVSFQDRNNREAEHLLITNF
jgi:DNA adenine methylase